VERSLLSFCSKQSSPNSICPFLLPNASSNKFFIARAEELVAYALRSKNFASLDSKLTQSFSNPGTVGGAVRGNAGAMWSDTARSLQKVEVWRGGEVLELNPEECGFGYQDSIFKHNGDVVLRA
jgi:UDP-N-acetylenolpyruvoylglucosamine reductase